MKPFFFLLLLIASAILCDLFIRPVELFTTATGKLGRRPDRLTTKRSVTSQVQKSRKGFVSPASWRPAAQF